MLSCDCGSLLMSDNLLLIYYPKTIIDFNIVASGGYLYSDICHLICHLICYLWGSLNTVLQHILANIEVLTRLLT